jgi:hypothetical protein
LYSLEYFSAVPVFPAISIGNDQKTPVDVPSGSCVAL